jgi:hypothetical protein
MTGSYREIDYRIRPAKHAERLMMCEAFRRLRFGTVESYQYVGLGSVYFSDFALFHRALRIDSMVSIEAEIQDEQRFMDNRPYANIRMLCGQTTTELPKVDLSLRSIVWLDFDGRLSRGILEDIRSVVTRICSGSVLVVSVQCRPETVDAAASNNPRARVEKMEKDLGSERVNPDWDDERLLGWGTARTFREIILNEIEAVVSQRNGSRPAAQRIEFEQVFNFHYKDGANMLTVGYVFFDRGQRGLFDEAAFDQLDFVKRGEEPFRIDIPLLTQRELRLLEKQMPPDPTRPLELGSMPARDAERFVKIYRHFPNFAAVDL